MLQVVVNPTTIRSRRPSNEGKKVNDQYHGEFICIVCLVTLKIGKTIPKKSTGYQIYFLIIFILRTD